jgi:hypothetical protein
LYSLAYHDIQFGRNELLAEAIMANLCGGRDNQAIHAVSIEMIRGRLETYPTTGRLKTYPRQVENLPYD